MNMQLCIAALCTITWYHQCTYIPWCVLICLQFYTAASSTVIAFDLHQLARASEEARSAVTEELRRILENPCITKVMWQCREAAAAMFLVWGLRIRPVHDTQV